MIRVGTRSSRLARAQTREVIERLDSHGHETEAVPLSTLGDRADAQPVHDLGVAGAFTTGLERALHAGQIDLAVHSLKDLPVEQPEPLELAAVLERGRPQDVLLADPSAWDPERELGLASGARVGTSGPRRQSQLLAVRPDLAITNVRGNVDTRVAKLREGRFDALVTARVALDRMELDLDEIEVHDLDPERFPPAPGQAAIAVQAREGSTAAEAGSKLDHAETRDAVRTERRVLDALGGGCGLPLGAWIRRTDEGWELDATFAGRDWRPDDEAQLTRVHETAASPADLVDPTRQQLEGTTSRPRRPSLASVDAPEGDPILVVASRPTAREWTAVLQAAGQASQPVPTRTFDARDPDPADRDRLERADWIAVTSRQAVEPLAEALDEPAGIRFAAVGPATARALQGQGLACHLVGPESTGESLADRLAHVAEPDETIVLAQGDTVHGSLRKHLAASGTDVDTCQAYRTREATIDPDEIEAALPAPVALVMSPRNARAVADAGPDRLAERYVALGPSTAAELESLGLDPAQPRAPTPDAVLELIG